MKNPFRQASSSDIVEIPASVKAAKSIYNLSTPATLPQRDFASAERKLKTDLESKRIELERTQIENGLQVGRLEKIIVELEKRNKVQISFFNLVIGELCL